MSWFFLAIIGHLANGIAFIIDKILLRSAFSRSATYAGIVGMLSFIVVAAVPFADRYPHGPYAVAAAVSGAAFILALWAFFAALSRAEASRIVPIVGSLIPILTLAGSFVFLGERLTDKTFFGFAILIFATIILSGGGKGRPSYDAIWLAVTSSFLFAVASVTGKATYDNAGFLGSFIVSRLVAAATALLLVTVIDRRALREVLSIVRPAHGRPTKDTKQPGKLAGLLAVIGQSLGAVGFLFVQWATAQGSASVVNAMQAIQYALLVAVGLALRKRAPHLLGENTSRNAIILKLLALVATAIGMAFVV